MRKETRKAVKLLLGFTATAFGGMGWLCSSSVSPAQPYIWFLTIPIMFFVCAVGSVMLPAWIDEDDFRCPYKPDCNKGKDIEYEYTL